MHTLCNNRVVISVSNNVCFYPSILQPISRRVKGVTFSRGGGMQFFNWTKKSVRELLLNFVFRCVCISRTGHVSHSHSHMYLASESQTLDTLITLVALGTVDTLDTCDTLGIWTLWTPCKFVTLQILISMHAFTHLSVPRTCCFIASEV